MCAISSFMSCHPTARIGTDLALNVSIQGHLSRTEGKKPKNTRGKTHIELSLVQADHEVHLVEFGEGIVDLFDDADDAVVRLHDGMDGSLPGKISPTTCVSTRACGR